MLSSTKGNPHLTQSCRSSHHCCLAGDLGAIDRQYDVAVSTAGPALDYMVVADTAAAQRCDSI